MAFELSALAAGLPVGASFAMAGGFVALRETRRRTALNAALHELRRPLQALSLTIGPRSGAFGSLESTLEIAVAAVERLDHEINGGATLVETHPFSARPVIETAVARWRPVASLEDRPLRFEWTAGNPLLEGCPIALAQAVDNMISNALVHGGGEIALEAAKEGRLLRLSVRDEGSPARSAARARSSRLRWSRGRRRHGHGLRVVRRVAARQGGDFRLVRLPGRTEASLVLPVGGGRS